MLHIIVNPSASSGRGGHVWKKIEQQVRASGKPYVLHFSSPDQGIEAIIADLTQHANDVTLFILGGDGSLNQAVNGIQDFAHTKLGFLQVGSGNDLQRDMDLPRQQREIVERVLREEVVRRCDVGEVTFHNRSDVQTGYEEDRYRIRRFNVGCGIGFDAEVCHAADISRFKSVLNAVHAGKLIYIVSAIRMIFGSETAQCQVRYGDGEKKSRTFHKLLLAACMNHQYQGGGFRFAPHASFADGKLDLCLAFDLPRLRFFRIFPTVYSGSHLRFGGIRYGQGVSFTLHTDRPLWVQTDGEVTCRSSQISVCLLPQVLRLVQ